MSDSQLRELYRVRRADHQPARRHRPAAGALRDRPARLPGDRPGRAPDRAARRRRRRRSTSSSRTARSSRSARTTAGPDCRLPCRRPVPLPADAPAGRARLLGAAGRRGRRRAAVHHVGNWRQPQRQVAFQGEVYHWSKHHEFLKFLDLPAPDRSAVRAGAERATSADDRQLLEAHGWRVRHGARSSDRPGRRTAITSRGRAASSPSPRTRTSGCGAAGSATAAPPTWRPAGRWSRRRRGSATSCRPARAVRVLDDGRGRRRRSRPIDADYAGHRRAAAEVAREYFRPRRRAAGRC